MSRAGRSSRESEPEGGVPIASFDAWIPPIQSAILIGIDGGQVKLQVPDEGVEELTKLALSGRSKQLRVLIYEA